MQRIKAITRFISFFLLGAFIAVFVLVAAGYLVFSVTFRHKIYPGIVDPATINLDYSGLTFTFDNLQFTGKDIGLHPNIDLMTKRAYSIGRQTANPYYNFLQILAAWRGKINLPLEISFDENTVNQRIDVLVPTIEKPPVDAIYKFVSGAGPDSKGRVSAFRPSEDGVSIDREKIREIIIESARRQKSVSQPLPTRLVSPSVKSTTADDLGIRSLIGRGESYFYDSIPGRVYNISLGTNKVSGSLIAPGEIFSFDNAIGTVSAIFGFQKAYSIVKGKTVLDDGGGVCQVSTTLYRAVLNAGLPVIERAPHAYRVGFYEQGGFLPGLDATVYPPSPDFRFKNDTGGWILIQANFDPASQKLTFDLFGSSDGRKTTLTGPYILSTTPPPEPIYEDDPTLPVGQVKQVDTAHYGARVYFQRTVTRGTDTLVNETVVSNYVPWPARYLKGTKT